MSSKIDDGADAVNKRVRAVRKSLSQALDEGHARVRDVVDASGRRTNDSLGAAEKTVIGVVDALAQRGRDYAKAGKDRAYEVDSRLFPRRRRSPVFTTLLAVGAGVLLSLVFRATPARKT